MDIFELGRSVSKDSLRSVKIEGSEFWIKELNANERDIMEIQWLSYRDKREGNVGGIRAFTVAFCLCDKDGKCLYDSGNDRSPTKEFKQTVEKMSGLPIRVIQPLWNTASKLNKMTEDDVEELEKN